MTAVFGLGQIVGPSFAGMLFDITGNFTLPTMGAAAALVLAAFLVQLAERRRLDHRHT